jgi:hypothetical protein
MKEHKSKKKGLRAEPYEIINQTIEVDTDINEDPNRERLLDDAISSFVQSKKAND